MWIFTLFCPRPIKLALLGCFKCLKSSYRFANRIKRLRQLLLWFKMAKNTTPKKFLRFFAVVKFFLLEKKLRVPSVFVVWADLFDLFWSVFPCGPIFSGCSKTIMYLKRLLSKMTSFFLQGLIREKGCLIIEPIHFFTNKE